MAEQYIQYNRPPGEFDKKNPHIPPSKTTVTQVTVVFLVALIITIVFNGF